MDSYATALDNALNAAKRRGITATAVGAATGLPSGEALVSQWRRGRRPVPASLAVVVAEMIGVRPEEISAAYARVVQSQGDQQIAGDAELMGRSVVGSDIPYGRPLKSDGRGPADPDAFMAFTFAPSHRAPGSAPFLNLPRQFLAERPTLMAPGIEVAVMPGDAMRGEIDAGSIVFIDTSVAEVQAEGVYAFLWVGRPMIKRIQIIASDGVRLRGTDKMDSVDVYGTERDALEIIGQVRGVLSLRSI